MNGLHMSQINLRLNKWLFVPFFTSNYSSASYFPRVLMSTNKIANYVDFFFMPRKVFLLNVYYT